MSAPKMKPPSKCLHNIAACVKPGPSPTLIPPLYRGHRLLFFGPDDVRVAAGPSSFPPPSPQSGNECFSSWNSLSWITVFCQLADRRLKIGPAQLERKAWRKPQLPRFTVGPCQGCAGHTSVLFIAPGIGADKTSPLVVVEFAKRMRRTRAKFAGIRAREREGRKLPSHTTT